MNSIRSRATGHRIGAVALALIAATGMTLAGCSSTGTAPTDSGSPAAGGVPQAVTDSLTKYEAAQPLDFAGSAIDVSAVKGDTVWWVIQEGANPFLATVYAHAKDALASVGVSVVQCDGKSNPVDANNCISQGVAQHASAIQVDGPDPSTVQNSAQAAVAAGIPVLTGSGVDASKPLPSYIAGVTSQPYALTGQLAADWVIADSNGTGNVLLITTPDVVGSAVQAQGFEDEISKYCPGCKVTEQGVTLGNWASDLGPTTSAALAKDPTIDYVAPVFDPMTQFTNPAIQQAGKSDSVKVVTVNGNLPFMQDLATGSSPTKAMIGLDLNALGYIEADQILRVLTKSPTVPNDYTAARVFTADSVKDLQLTDSTFGDSSWYGGSGTTQTLFASLWNQ